MINLAYSTVVEPRLLDSLLDTIANQVQQDLQSLSPSDALDEARDVKTRLEVLERHIVQAQRLAESRGDRFDSASVSRRSILYDDQPAALFDASGLVVLANNAAERWLGLRNGRRASDLKVEPSRRQELRKGFANLNAFTIDEVFLNGVHQADAEDGDPLHFALTKVQDEKGVPFAKLSTMTMGWDDKVGRRFQLAMSLSDAELAIVRGVVRGQTLQKIAEDRERQVGTVRQQLKSVYQKTRVNSQVRLASLYSGFSQLIRYTSPDTPTADKSLPELETTFLQRADGTQIQIDFAGPADGTPVLHFHTMNIGHTLTPELMDQLRAQNVRLVMLWRPGWGGTQKPLDSRPKEAILADDVETVLDYLNVNRIDVLAMDLGGVWAISCALLCRANSLPRIKSITWMSPALSVRRRQDTRHLNKGITTYFYLARYARPLLEAFVYFALSKVDAGYDEEHMRYIYRHSPADLELIANRTIISRMRESLKTTRLQGTEAFIDDLALKASNWDYLDRLHDVPVHMIFGDQHFSTGDEFAAQVCEGRANLSYEMVKDAGTLFFLTRPKRVFAALRRMIDLSRA